MTTHFFGCQITAKDFHICRTMLETLADPGSPSARLLRSKLDTATIVSDDDVDPLVVTLNSRIEFQVDDEAPQMRIVVKSEFRNGLVGMTLPISTPRGMALLGLRQEQACTFDEGGRMRNLIVRRIAYQPQAARSGRSVSGSNPDAPLHQGKIINFMRVREARIARAACNSAKMKGIRN